MIMNLLAKILPKEMAYWAAVRLLIHATNNHTEPSNLTFGEVLQRWHKQPPQNQGLYNKFIVLKRNGKTNPQAFYFVLRLDKSIEARDTILYYAKLIREKLPFLSSDLEKLIIMFETENKEIEI